MQKIAYRISEQVLPCAILELGGMGWLRGKGPIRAFYRVRISRQTPPPRHKYVTESAETRLILADGA